MDTKSSFGPPGAHDLSLVSAPVIWETVAGTRFGVALVLLLEEIAQIARWSAYWRTLQIPCNNQALPDVRQS